MKKFRKGIVAVLSLAALSAFSVGATLATSADAVIDESKFVMAKEISVRTEGTAEHPDATGLRFKTVAKEFKEDLNAAYSTNAYNYRWYTELRFKKFEGDYSTDAKGNTYHLATTYEKAVSAQVWNDEGGWNTILLGIPMSVIPDDLDNLMPYDESNVALDITAQSFVEITDKVTGEVVYDAETDTLTYSAAKAAALALAYHKYENDTQKEFLLTYVNNAIDCGDIKDINLFRTTFGIQVGTSDWLEASSYPKGYAVTYTSANPSIAKVDNDGRVTGMSVGTTQITVSIGSTISKVCTVTVRENGDVAPTFNAWSGGIYNTYPIYGCDNSGTATNSNITVSDSGVLKVTGASTSYFCLDDAYAKQAFELSNVKALRIKISNFPTGYDIHHFITLYPDKEDDTNDYDSYLSFKNEGDIVYLQINRAAWEHYLTYRATDTTLFSFRMQHCKEGVLNGNVSLYGMSYNIDSIEPIYDDLTLDFEDRAYNDPYVYTSQYVIPSAETVEIAKVTDRNMGRGDYSLATTTSETSMSVSIASAYAKKVFASANALQFRVYTDKNLTGVTVNGSSTNVQYVYNVDGEYYTIRIAKAVGSTRNLTVVLNGSVALGTVYFDAFTGTDKALGLNVSRADAYATDDGGETKFDSQETFRFYAYSSVNDGLVKHQGQYMDMEVDKVPSVYKEGQYCPTLESFQALKDVGMYAIMPQTAALVGKGDANFADLRYTNGFGLFNYGDVLDLAAKVGLKVVLTDNILLYASRGSDKMSSDASVYNSALDANGAAVVGTPLYNYVKAQLLCYINHPAFYGVMLTDEPSSEVFEPYGIIYKTVKKVAADMGKDIYIHANLIGATTWASYTDHTNLRYPELTVKRYGEITGMDVSAYAVNGTTEYYAEPTAAFYTALENYIAQIGSSGGHDNYKRHVVHYAIMRERFAAYCQAFIDATDAPFIAPDFYPLYSEGPMSNYLMAIQVAAEVARANNVDLYVVTQTQSYVPGTSTSTRILSDKDVRWLNNTLLSFGVKNIMYFTYHHHGDDSQGFFHDGSSFMYISGEKTPLWYNMQKVMAENQAFASTYQSFELNATKAYYNAFDLHDSDHVAHAKDVIYDKTIFDNAAGKPVEVNFAVASVATDAEAAIVSEFVDGKGNYMYSVMNVIDAQYTDSDTYQTVTLTFDATYTYVILWRNGVKKLVKLDEFNSLTIENGAGEAAYIIPYTYMEYGYFWDSEQEDNGVWFPSEDVEEGIWS